MQTIQLSDGYNGAMKTFNANPVELDSDLVKVTEAGKDWLIRWVYRDEWETAIRRRMAKLNPNAVSCHTGMGDNEWHQLKRILDTVAHKGN